MNKFTPLNFKKWIEDNRHFLKPPVGNKLVWEDRDFVIMVVGGPNCRTDYHINSGEEFFYQLEGDIHLRVLRDGMPVVIPICEGDIFLLPSNVPHSPQRPANTVGLVIEHRRLEHEKDGFLWICEGCNEKLYEEYIVLKNIVKDLPPVFERFYSNPLNTTCKKCGKSHAKN